MQNENKLRVIKTCCFKKPIVTLTLVVMLCAKDSESFIEAARLVEQAVLVSCLPLHLFSTRNSSNIASLPEKIAGGLVSTFPACYRKLLGHVQTT